MEVLLYIACVLSVLIILYSILIQIKESYTNSSSIITKETNEALLDYEDTTCIPFKKAKTKYPEIMDEISVKSNMIQSYNKSPNHCVVMKPNNTFDCSKNNPDLYTKEWQKNSSEKIRLGDRFRDSVHDIKDGEANKGNNSFGMKEVCIIKFDPYLDHKEALNYAQYLSSRNPYTKEIIEKVNTLLEEKTKLETRINGLNNDIGKLNGKITEDAVIISSKEDLIRQSEAQIKDINKKLQELTKKELENKRKRFWWLR